MYIHTFLGLDSRYLELPVVIDEEEINILKESKNKKRKKDKGYDFLGLNSGICLRSRMTICNIYV
jgi:hypothetical protein